MQCILVIVCHVYLCKTVALNFNWTVYYHHCWYPICWRDVLNFVIDFIFLYVGFNAALSLKDGM